MILSKISMLEYSLTQMATVSATESCTGFLASPPNMRSCFKVGQFHRESVVSHENVRLLTEH